jgi:hypothetical protein
MMVSPEHIDNHKPEDQQAPSPGVPQQVPAVVEKKRTWLKLLMRGAALVLSLVGSFAGFWAFFMQPSNIGEGWAILGAILLGTVSAILYRSWWALLVIPIAFSAGAFLAIYLMPLVISPNPLAVDDVGFGAFLWAVFGPIFAVFGALLGILILKTLEPVRRQ